MVYLLKVWIAYRKPFTSLRYTLLSNVPLCMQYSDGLNIQLG
jgi:hypothetical protein